jgi:hypothetical protein
MPEMTVDDIVARGQELLTPENLDDSRIDSAAQEAIMRLGQGATADKVCAIALLSGVKAEAGGLNGIFADDSGDAEDLAQQLETDASALVPEDEDAAVISVPDGSAPAIVFRSGLRDDASRLDPALAGSITGARTSLSDQVDLGAAGDPTRPWLCTWVCGLCAAALLDGVPFDEIPVCLACLTCVAGQG